MMPKPQLSIIIPCYNEEKNIPLVLKRFSEVIGRLDAELILVNNGSTDNSQEILEEELKKPQYSFARTVLVPKNLGYGYGILTGIKKCRADLIAYTHADMQCDPLDVIRGYNIISKKENPEKHLIKGWRIRRKINQKILSLCFQFTASILFLQNFSEINAQPKVFHRSFINHLTCPPLDSCLDLYLIYKAKKVGLKTISIVVEFPGRRYGQSKVFSNSSAAIKTIIRFIKYLLKLRFLGEEEALRTKKSPKSN